METLADPRILLARLQEAGLALERREYGARERLLSLCRTLIASLETPIETLLRMGWAEPARNADCRIAVNLGLFEHMRRAEAAGAQALTARGLAEQSGVHPAMISRIMKHLAAMNVVGECDIDTFVLLPFSRSLTNPVYRHGIISNHDIIGPVLSHLPKHLQDTNYEYPISRNNQAFHAAHRTDLSIKDWCVRNPLYGTAWNSFTGTVRAETAAFPDPGLYPLFHRLIQPFNPYMSFKNMFPNHPGRLILENTNPDSEYAPGHEGLFDIIRYDLSGPQPVRGARAYYWRTALLKYDEVQSIRVLGQLRQAMAPGYSILLLDEISLPAWKANWIVTSAERVENAANARLERTDAELNSIVHRAGLRVRRWYPPALGLTVLVELEVN